MLFRSWAVVLCKVESFLDRKVCKILITESYNFVLGHEECQLVLSSPVELAELRAEDFGSDVGGELLNLDTVCDEIWKGRISISTVVVSVEVLIWRVFHFIPI